MATTNPDQQIAEAEGAYLSIGGWAKEMPNPPALNERRRFIIDVECTAAGIKASQNGTRHTRSLSILRLTEVKDAVVPPADEDPNQAQLFEDGDGGDGGPDNVVPIGK